MIYPDATNKMYCLIVIEIIIFKKSIITISCNVNLITNIFKMSIIITTNLPCLSYIKAHYIKRVASLLKKTLLFKRLLSRIYAYLVLLVFLFVKFIHWPLLNKRTNH